MNFVALRARLITLKRCKRLILRLNIQTRIMVGYPRLLFVHCSSTTRIPNTEDRRSKKKRHKIRPSVQHFRLLLCVFCVLCLCLCSLFNGKYFQCFKMNIRNCLSSLLFFFLFLVRRSIKSLCVNICFLCSLLLSMPMFSMGLSVANWRQLILCIQPDTRHSASNSYGTHTYPLSQHTTSKIIKLNAMFNESLEGPLRLSGNSKMIQAMLEYWVRW